MGYFTANMNPIQEVNTPPPLPPKNFEKFFKKYGRREPKVPGAHSPAVHTSAGFNLEAEEAFHRASHVRHIVHMAHLAHRNASQSTYNIWLW